MDASWTPKGYIVYSAFDNHKVEVMMETGNIIASNQMSSSQYLSVSNDGAICLADEDAGLYQSIDDGFS